MRIYVIILSILTFSFQSKAQFSLSPLSPLPEKMSNGGIEFARNNGVDCIYLWGALDSTASASGIMQRGYKLNLNENIWSPLPDLPDTSAKLAFSASRIGNIIYVVGGYHVVQNGNEISSNKVHRFSLSENEFVNDAAPIPTAIDDQVQLVYKDSLIYVITGWSNTFNVGNVQVYNSFNNTWTAANQLPINGNFRAFGASGCIIGDTIYYFGGATIGIDFPASNRLCKGYIHPENPLQIDWTSSIPDASLRRYRTACIAANQLPHWVGGSSVSYNYDGIAYNGSGPVSPSGTILQWNYHDFDVVEFDDLPMDIRALAQVNDSTWIIAGGLTAGPLVSEMVWLLRYSTPMKIKELQQSLRVFPVPAHSKLNIELEKKVINLEILDKQLKVVLTVKNTQTNSFAIDISSLNAGFYWLKLEYSKGEIEFQRIIIE